jgi:hypothetical protein
VVVHDWLGIALIVFSAAGATLAIISTFRSQMLPWVRRYVRVISAAVGIQVVIGLVLFATGERPQQAIHWFYGAATLLALPFSMWMGTPLAERQRRLWLAGGAVATLLFAIRAVMTG